MIISHLHIYPGNIVVESGTGSGVMTTYLARTVGKTGRVYSFEVNEERFKILSEDFSSLNLINVTIVNRDVYKDGFDIGPNLKADAVFLDLPAPWLAIPQALKILKPFGRLCTFSPCIEQVQRSIDLLLKLGFSCLKTYSMMNMDYGNIIHKTQAPVSFLHQCKQISKLE